MENNQETIRENREKLGTMLKEIAAGASKEEEAMLRAFAMGMEAARRIDGKKQDEKESA